MGGGYKVWSFPDVRGVVCVMRQGVDVIGRDDNGQGGQQSWDQ